jgi:glycosyltransferase involved in cell wall biosynthesis
MACGTPVIAFKQGSMPELIKDGETGFLVDSIEEAVSALKKIEEIKRENCRNWVKENFSLRKMVNRYEKLYKKILKKNEKT